MKFKRWRVSVPNRDVNVGLALSVSFLITACGEAGETIETSNIQKSEISTPTRELPVVWASRSLEGPVADMAASSGASPLLAVAYEGRGLQFFNFNGERVAESAPYAVTSLASGFSATIAGADMTIFPGLNAEGDLSAYLFGAGLRSPVEVNLPIDDDTVSGLCSGPTSFGDQALFKLAYWTTDTPNVLHSGAVFAVDEEFLWTPEDSVTDATPIGGCRFEAGASVTVSGSAIDSAMLRRGAYEARITIGVEGGLLVTEPGAEPVRYNLRDGLSVRAPERPTSIVAVGQPLGGGYPGGVIILSGEISPDDHQAVFIDASVLTVSGE